MIQIDLFRLSARVLTTCVMARTFGADEYKTAAEMHSLWRYSLHMLLHVM